MGREGIEPLVDHHACFLTTGLQTAAWSTTQRQVARVGVEPTNNHEGLSFAAFPFAYRAIFLLRWSTAFRLPNRVKTVAFLYHGKLKLELQQSTPDRT